MVQANGKTNGANSSNLKQLSFSIFLPTFIVGITVSLMIDNRELLFSHQACDVLYNPQLKAVETRWKGPSAEGSALYRILDSVIDAMQLKNTGVVIADARQMNAINHQDTAWITNDWYPRALAAGFRYEALIVTDYTFNAVTVRKIVRTYDEKKLKTAYFKTLPGAYDWVKNGFPD